MVNIKYSVIAFLYGGVRKLIYTYDTRYKKISYNEKHEKIITEVPILHTDRIMFFVFGGVNSIFISPLYLMNDIRCIEMIYRNIKIDNRSITSEVTFTDIMIDHHFTNSI